MVRKFGEITNVIEQRITGNLFTTIVTTEEMISADVMHVIVAGIIKNVEG
jgi:hypothetical protein